MEKTGFFVAIALIAAGLTACDQQQEKKQQVLKVTVETVTKSSNASVSTYVGQVEEQAATSLSFTGIGNIKQVLVTEGQHVSKGQLVAVLDEVQARNALASAETSLTQAQDGYDRLKQVYEGGSLAEQKWVEVQSQLQQARNMRDIARKNLQDCRLISPVSGVVGDLTLEAGETALPSAPVCNVLNIDNVKVKVAIPEHEIAAITATTPSTISVEATGGQPLKGGRIEKGVTADALTRTYDIKILLPNPGHNLLPGMGASVQLPPGVIEGGLATNYSASDRCPTRFQRAEFRLAQEGRKGHPQGCLRRAAHRQPHRHHFGTARGRRGHRRGIPEGERGCQREVTFYMQISNT